jgi:PAS domain S-box-containing protein
MSAVTSCPTDFRLAFHGNLSDSYELSNVLLATADFDGTLQLLTAGWERVLGYGREELQGKTLGTLMWCDRRAAAAAVAAILDRLGIGPVDVRVRCRDGLGKCFRLHRHYDEHEQMMYLVAEETPRKRTGAWRDGPDRRAAARPA